MIQQRRQRMGKTALMRDIVEGILSVGSVSTLTSWHSFWIKNTTMQICTPHYPKDVTSSCPDSPFMILPIRACRVLGEAFKGVLAGAMPWAALLVLETLKVFSAHCLFELLQKEKEQSPFPLELPWQCWCSEWCSECRVGPELPECKKHLWTSLTETVKDQVRRKDLFPVTLP